MIGRLFVRLRRILKYIPILWRDYDWDCTPGLELLMKKKLEMLLPELVHGAHAEKDKKRIRICMILLDRLADQYYETKFHERHEKKWGELKMELIPIDQSDAYRADIYHVRAREQGREEEERREFRRNHKHAIAQDQRARDYVYAMLAKYSTSWWD